MTYRSHTGRYAVLSALFHRVCKCSLMEPYTCGRCEGLDYLREEWPDEYATMAHVVAKARKVHNAS